MDKTLLENLLHIVTRYKGRISVSCLMVLFSNVLLILNPLIFREALLTLVPQSGPQHQIAPFYKFVLGSAINSIYGWAVLLLAIAITSALLRYYMRYIFIAISREVEKDVRATIFAKIQIQSKAFFDRHPVGDLISRLTNDITAYRDVLGPGLMYPISFVTLMIPAFIALFSLSAWMALLSFLPIISIYALNLLIRTPLYRISHLVQSSLAEMSTMAHEHYSGIRIIKSYGIEAPTFQRFKKLCHQFSFLNMRLSSFQGMLFPILSLITKVTTILLVLLASAIILLRWGSLSLADFLSFMWIQSYIFGPLLMLGWILPMYQRGKAAYMRLVEIYEEPIEVCNRPEALPHLPVNPDITFDHFTFSYPTQRKPSLVDLNLTIHGGTFVGITGPVGAGKTTLLRVLSREYEVQEGKIIIGGHDIHAYSLNAFHQELVTVEQIPFLFSKTIGENVRFGKPDATADELERVSRQADLHDTVIEFPLQYETMVGERGVSLSGGQKQRVAMARAFLVNRSILLLDDIFSAVDAATEQRIFQEMKANFSGKTILLVTHRVSILQQVDRLIYLRDGQIVEDGTPQKLLQRQGPYKALVDLQRMHML